MKNRIGTILLFLLFTLQSFSLGQNPRAKQKLIQLKVKGLSCAFCAYGLERKFMKDPKIISMEIDIEKGLVYLRVNQNYIVLLEQIEEKVNEAGFTLEKIRIINEKIKTNKMNSHGK